MTRSRYAADTDVPPERSRQEIERTLTRYGADAFGYGWVGDKAAVSFRADGRYVQIGLAFPDREETAYNAAGTRMAPRQAEQAHEKAIRQRWRVLALLIKAKLEAVAAGVETFEEAFLPYVVLPDGSTVGEVLAPQIEQAYETGRMPAGIVLALPAGD